MNRLINEVHVFNLLDPIGAEPIRAVRGLAYWLAT